MRVRLLAWAVIVVLAAACGSDDAVTVDEPAAAGTGAAASDAPASSYGDVPDLEMVSVHTGETVDLQSLVSGETPLLFWFWAPH